MNGLRLTISDGPVIDNPSSNDIERALRAMEVDQNEFAILERGELDYMQTAGGSDNNLYALEYQESSLDRHYQTDPMPLSSVIEAFQQYARGEDAAWKSRFGWKRFEL
jgi:hypothetical protein